MPKWDEQKNLELVEDYAKVCASHNRLLTALKWALPLAEITLENTRQERLKYGHDDIGRGTEDLGLWAAETGMRSIAREAIRTAHQLD